MSEDEDSAPEDITFKEAKNEALEQLKNVKEAVDEKKERKEKQRKRQAILKEQKEKIL